MKISAPETLNGETHRIAGHEGNKKTPAPQLRVFPQWRGTVCRAAEPRRSLI
ncbi:MAG: hypothetical protein IJD43_08000 [Thermoguttaceae bacterium]|nr:hypothetical protein [Thermoguttaceae bacterium]